MADTQSAGRAGAKRQGLAIASGLSDFFSLDSAPHATIQGWYTNDGLCRITIQCTL